MEPTSENPAELKLNHLIVMFIRFCKFLLSKWVILCIFGFTGGILGIVYGYLEEPKYEAALSFSTEDDQSSGAGGFAGLAAQFGLNLGSVGGVFTGDNILSLVASRKMITATLLTPVNESGKQKSLLNIYLDATHLSEKFKKDDSLKNLSFPVGQNPETFSRVQDSVLLLVADGIAKNVLKVDKPDKNLNIYSVDCITNNEFFSATFVTQLLSEVSDFYVTTKTKMSQQTLDIIQKRADSVKQAFDVALEGRASLTDANINPALQLPQVGIEKKQTDITVLGTAYGEILKNLELARFNLLRETPYIQIIDEPLMPLPVKKIGKLLGGILGGFIFGIFGIIFLVSKRTVKIAKEKYS
jgi:hypothetical protein